MAVMKKRAAVLMSSIVFPVDSRGCRVVFCSKKNSELQGLRWSLDCYSSSFTYSMSLPSVEEITHGVVPVLNPLLVFAAY